MFSKTWKQESLVKNLWMRSTNDRRRAHSRCHWLWRHHRMQARWWNRRGLCCTHPTHHEWSRERRWHFYHGEPFWRTRASYLPAGPCVGEQSMRRWLAFQWIQFGMVKALWINVEMKIWKKFPEWYLNTLSIIYFVTLLRRYPVATCSTPLYNGHHPRLRLCIFPEENTSPACQRQIIH